MPRPPSRPDNYSLRFLVGVGLAVTVFAETVVAVHVLGVRPLGIAPAGFGSNDLQLVLLAAAAWIPALVHVGTSRRRA